MTEATRPGHPTEEPRASLSLLDYRRRVADLYARVRHLPPAEGHALWSRSRDELLRTHPRSPIPPERRAAFRGLPVWPYDVRYRFEAEVRPTQSDARVELPHSAAGSTPGWAVGTIDLDLSGEPVRLSLFRLSQYGDALFLPFADGTAGRETYGGGRYVIDTAKGADLGSHELHLVIDFNFAYHPSCVHDTIWSCPLAPVSNRFDHPLRVGEHLAIE
jgi:uncharacterized protein (DUF1684 family)